MHKKREKFVELIYCHFQQLVEKMFDVLSVTSSNTQREIISCIPEVIDNLQHVDVAHKLKLVSVKYFVDPKNRGFQEIGSKHFVIQASTVLIEQQGVTVTDRQLRCA